MNEKAHFPATDLRTPEGQSQMSRIIADVEAEQSSPKLPPAPQLIQPPPPTPPVTPVVAEEVPVATPQAPAPQGAEQVGGAEPLDKLLVDLSGNPSSNTNAQAPEVVVEQPVPQAIDDLVPSDTIVAVDEPAPADAAQAAPEKGSSFTPAAPVIPLAVSKETPKGGGKDPIGPGRPGWRKPEPEKRKTNWRMVLATLAFVAVFGLGLGLGGYAMWQLKPQVVESKSLQAEIDRLKPFETDYPAALRERDEATGIVANQNGQIATLKVEVERLTPFEANAANAVRERDEANATIAGLNMQISNLTDEKTGLQAEIERLIPFEDDYATAVRERDEANGTITGLQTQVSTLTGEKAGLEQLLAVAEDNTSDTSLIADLQGKLGDALSRATGAEQQLALVAHVPAETAAPVAAAPAPQPVAVKAAPAAPVLVTTLAAGISLLPSEVWGAEGVTSTVGMLCTMQGQLPKDPAPTVIVPPAPPVAHVAPPAPTAPRPPVAQPGKCSKCTPSVSGTITMPGLGENGETTGVFKF